jgi:hypothetical protein
MQANINKWKMTSATTAIFDLRRMDCLVIKRYIKYVKVGWLGPAGLL